MLFVVLKSGHKKCREREREREMKQCGKATQCDYAHGEVKR